jgi:hypothetical protein
MDKVVKNISNENLDYYREHIDECPIDILRVLYAEKAESEAYLYDAYQDAGKKMFEYAEKCEELERKIEIKDKYLELVYQLGVDYDGYDTVGGLKSLIDELVGLAKRAANNDDKWAAFQGFQGEDEKYYNILFEEVEKTEEF